MTNADRDQAYVIRWPLAKDHYFNPVDFADPKSPWENKPESDEAKQRRQRNAQRVRYRQRVAQRKQAA